jgi:hypothetical protein
MWSSDLWAGLGLGATSSIAFVRPLGGLARWAPSEPEPSESATITQVLVGFRWQTQSLATDHEIQGTTTRLGDHRLWLELPSPVPILREGSTCRWRRKDLTRRRTTAPVWIMKALLLLLLAIFSSQVQLGGVQVQAAGALSATHKSALVELYNSTNGPGWRISTNWLAGDPCSSRWVGVVCAGPAPNVL